MSNKSPNRIVYFYSKYSKNSMVIHKKIKKYKELSNIENVCVDSDIVRQMLLKDSTMSINSVPCFVNIYR